MSIEQKVRGMLDVERVNNAVDSPILQAIENELNPPAEPTEPVAPEEPATDPVEPK